ncbi:hypothetical protein V2J09_020941 [Rumex salicifolius]
MQKNHGQRVMPCREPNTNFGFIIFHFLLSFNSGARLPLIHCRFTSISHRKLKADSNYPLCYFSMSIAYLLILVLLYLQDISSDMG